MTAGKRILIVDDDREFAEANRVLLEAHGYEVLVAHDGPAGIAAAQTGFPNLMLLDVMMTSDTEGFDVSRKIRQIPALRDLPIILLTGIKKAMNLPFAFEPDKDWLPVCVVLEKPIPPEKLLAEIEKQLG